MAKAKSTTGGLIPAVRYLRKSTKGERPDGRERQENSIGQQRKEIDKLAKGRYLIVREYVDEGVSGWKRDGKRPEFDRMLRDAKDKRDFQAVLCDDLDRFSRADVMEVFADLTTLATGSVRMLHCVNQGEYNLGERGDIGKIIKLVVDIHGGNEFSRKLGRRIALTRRNLAHEGKRSGGNAPYAYRNDGNGGLVLGEPGEVETVRTIYRWFTDDCRSLRNIAGELNARGTKPPRGPRWSNQTLRLLMTNEVYRGNFVYNLKKTGEFFIVDGSGNVVEAPAKGPERKSWRPTLEGAIRHDGAHPAIVKSDLWERAQERLDSFARNHRRPKSVNPYPLTGCLVCDHCGGKLYGVRVKKKVGGRQYQHTEYRCEGSGRFGKSVCRYHTVREQRILPYLVKKIAGELTAAHERLLRPKVESVIRIDDEADATIKRLEKQLEAADAKLRQADESFLVATGRQRERLQSIIATWQADRDAVAEQLAAEQSKNGHCDLTDLSNVDIDELKRFVEWQREKLINVPSIPGSDLTWPTDAAGLREVLSQLGCEVRLRWTCERKRWGGEVRNYHQLGPGCTYTIGKHRGNFRTKPLARVCHPPVAASCSGIPAADRCGNRRGRG